MKQSNNDHEVSMNRYMNRALEIKDTYENENRDVNHISKKPQQTTRWKCVQ